MEASQTVPIELVRTTAAFAERQGWDAAALLRDAGVSPSLLTDPRSRVTDDQVVQLVQHLWQETDDELLGLGPHPLPRGSFRLLCYGLLGSADLGDTLGRLRGFLRAVPAIPLRIETDEATTTLSIPRLLEDHEDEMFLMLVGLAATHRLLSWVLRRELALVEVTVPGPSPADPELVRYAFAGPVRFDAPTAGLRFANKWLREPIARDESDVDQLIASSPRALLQRPSYDSTTADRVRRIVEQDLKRGVVASSESVARRLSISPQTLRRRLAEESSSLRGIVEKVRRDAAVTSLVEGRESVADLATRLGFSEPSAFSRAFRRWTGSAPGSYRQGPAGPTD